MNLYNKNMRINLHILKNKNSPFSIANILFSHHKKGTQKSSFFLYKPSDFSIYSKLGI